MAKSSSQSSPQMVLPFSPKDILIFLRLREETIHLFNIVRLLLRSNPPDANLSAYLPIWLPVDGIFCGLQFLHLTDIR